MASADMPKKLAGELERIVLDRIASNSIGNAVRLANALAKREGLPPVRSTLPTSRR